MTCVFEGCVGITALWKFRHWRLISDSGYLPPAQSISKLYIGDLKCVFNFKGW